MEQSMRREIINTLFKQYLVPMKNTNDYIKHDICSDCRGFCCMRMGCHFSPSDFKEITTESLIDFIDKSGCVSIDWYEGSPFELPGDEHSDSDIDRAYFLRIRNKDADIIDPSFYGRCILLTHDGCMLDDNIRPFGGISLIPIRVNSKFMCQTYYTKQDCARDWFQYDDILKEVFDHFC